MNDINLKITIDGKEANATIQLTDENIKQLYKSYKLGSDQAGDASTAMLRGLTNARDAIGGLKEVGSLLSGIFGEGIQKAHDYELAMAKIEGVIKSNGSAAGYTAGEIDKLSSSFSKSSLFSKSDILNAQQILLTFENIGHDTLPMATQAVMGLASTMGTDMAGAAKTMGMVLENPVEMMRRLRSMGIVLDADQKEHIKTVQEEQGINAAGAVILEILAKKYGEVNTEIQKTDAFKINQMEKEFSKLQKTAGGMEASLVEPFLNIGSAISAVNPKLGGLAVMAGQVTTALVTLRVTGIMPAFSSMSLFGNSLASLGGLIAAGGILAGVAALTYGLDKLSTAYQKAKIAQDNYQNAGKQWQVVNEQRISSYKTIEEVNTEINVQTDELERLKKLKKDTEDDIASHKKNKDKIISESRSEFTDTSIPDNAISGGEALLKTIEQETLTAQDAIKKSQEKLDVFNKQATDHTIGALIERTQREIEQLKLRQKGLDESNTAEYNSIQKSINAKNALLEKYSDKKQKPEKIKSQDKEIKSEIDQEQEAQRHEIAMMEIAGKSDEEIKLKKIDHYYQMEQLLIKHNQSTSGIHNSIIEAEAQFEADKNKKKLDAEEKFWQDTENQMASDDAKSFEDMKKRRDEKAELKKVSTENNTDMYARQTEEADIEHEANLTRILSYKNYTELKTQYDKQHELKLKEIEQAKSDNQIAQTTRAVTAVAGIFGKQTLAYKVLTGAVILMEGIKAAQAALSPPPIGLGPVFGIPLAVATGVTTAVNLAKLAAVKVTGYASGSTALVGENGPEIIAPLQEYAGGQAMMVKSVLDVVDYHLQSRAPAVSQLSFAGIEKIMSEKLQGFTEAINNINLVVDELGIALAGRKGERLLGKYLS